MSYILDALRKAEAERERGSVPNIHAQPAFAGAPAAGARPTSRLWIVVAVVGLLLAVAAALPWFLMAGRSPAATPVAAATVTAPAAAQLQVQAPASAAVALPPMPAPTPPTAVAAVAPPTPTPARKARTAPAAASAAGASAAAASAAAPRTEERVYALNELPDDIRRQLPGISLGGSMYSTTPASRLVIVNGQVLHEGDRLTPELVLQQIKLKAAVFAFKGYRFSVTF